MEKNHCSKNLCFTKTDLSINCLKISTSRYFGKKRKFKIFDFKWDSKPDKIKRSVIMQDYYFNERLRLTNKDYFIEALNAG